MFLHKYERELKGSARLHGHYTLQFFCKVDEFGIDFIVAMIRRLKGAHPTNGIGMSEGKDKMNMQFAVSNPYILTWEIASRGDQGPWVVAVHRRSRDHEGRLALCPLHG